MPDVSVVFHRLAAREYRSARDWYADRAPEVAENFRIAVDRAVSRISSRKESLPKLRPVYRFARVQRFPYVLIFRERTQESVMVVAVAHTSRRPGYWRGRRRESE